MACKHNRFSFINIVIANNFIGKSLWVAGQTSSLFAEIVKQWVDYCIGRSTSWLSSASVG